MIVKFDYTPEELVDAATRLLNRSKTYRRTWWYGLLATFAFGWLASFVLVVVIFRQMSIAVAIGSVIDYFVLLLIHSVRRLQCGDDSAVS